MPNLTRVTGVRTVIGNLMRADQRFRRGVSLGLKKGGLFVQRLSQKEVPVEFGPLKASAFTRAEGLGFQTKVTVGYTAFYALFVHEAVGMVLRGLPRLPNPPHKGRYWDPQGKGKAKFLEDPVRYNRDEIGNIVRATAFQYR